MMQQKQINQMIAWVAVLATVFVVLFSAFYISKNIEHHCTGEDCPVCETLVLCSNTLKNIGTAVILVAAVCFIVEVLKLLLSKGANTVSCNSLISQKVRLNN